MPDVHGFGHVGRGKIDDDRARSPGLRNPELGIRPQLLQTRLEPRLPQAEIQKARSGNLHPAAQIIHRQPVQNRLGHRPGVRLGPLGQDHGDITLVVAKTGIRSRRDMHLHPISSFYCRKEPGFENEGDGFHRIKSREWLRTGKKRSPLGKGLTSRLAGPPSDPPEKSPPLETPHNQATERNPNDPRTGEHLSDRGSQKSPKSPAGRKPARDVRAPRGHSKTWQSQRGCAGESESDPLEPQTSQ